MGNDITIISSIILFFFILGASLPFINDAFGINEASDNDPENIVSDIGEQMTNSTTASIFAEFIPTGGITIFTVIGSIFKIFFWTFGDIPFWLDVSVFMVLRIVLGLVIARNIWIGGGS